ncbi:MAG: ArsR/SmtB family transcription factor [Halothiobacillus sp.]
MAFKQDLNNQFARMGKVLGSGRRLELLDYLAQGARSVEQLATVSGLSVANTSQHLQKMQQAGLVRAERHGKQIFYQLADNEVITLMTVLRGLAERHLAEVREMVSMHLTRRDGLEPVSAEELLARARSGLVTVLDVRPPEEYAAGHVPGAVNISAGQLREKIATLDPSREVIAYCRGPYCTFSFEAVALLRAEGFSARRLEAGFPEWKQAGHPIETEHTPLELTHD